MELEKEIELLKEKVRLLEKVKELREAIEKYKDPNPVYIPTPYPVYPTYPYQPYQPYQPWIWYTTCGAEINCNY